MDRSYRIAYEAFAQLAPKLNRTRSLDELRQCLAQNLKYLFTFQRLGVTFLHPSDLIRLLAVPGECTLERATPEAVTPLEQQIAALRLPRVWKAEADAEVLAAFSPATDALHELWGWHFGDESERQLVVLMGSRADYPISHKDVAIVRLLAETLLAKLMELHLFDEIETKNARIESLVLHQESIIRQQTAEIEAKNSKLIEILSINAHNMREPLTRILGLIGLVGTDASLACEILPMLEASSHDLDQILQQVIDLADAELIPADTTKP